MTEQIPDPESLEKRMEKLEHQNQRMKWGAAFISIVLITGTLILFQNPRTRSQTTLQSLTVKAIQA
jgi:hypothetical protein